MDHLEPKQAFEFLKKDSNALFIDCRSEMEYLFVGHPIGALQVAWNDGPDWDVNPLFVGQVKKLAGTNHTTRPIMLICRSGNRSQDACAVLEQRVERPPSAQLACRLALRRAAPGAVLAAR